jgi:hypothetical protein
MRPLNYGGRHDTTRLAAAQAKKDCWTVIGMKNDWKRVFFV